jgi:hypothetical protein
MPCTLDCGRDDNDNYHFEPRVGNQPALRRSIELSEATEPIQGRSSTSRRNPPAIPLVGIH